MKKLRIGMFFSLAFKAPHQNAQHICAPMVLVDQLAGALSARGHDIRLLVSRDSANRPYYYRSPVSDSLSKNKRLRKFDAPELARERTKLSMLYNQAALADFLRHNPKLDILHLHHADYALPLLTQSLPALITVHDPVTELHRALFRQFRRQTLPVDVAFLTRSQARAAGTPNTHIVPSGIIPKDYPFTNPPRDHLAFAGRIIGEKGPRIAFRVAQKTRRTLRMIGEASKGDIEMLHWLRRADKRFFNYQDELPYHKVPGFLSIAKALLFPIQWDEPFGLVMIEAMATGTPVVAFNRGSVPEVVKNGETGFIVKTEREMVASVKKIYAMPDGEYAAMRRACREHVEKSFSLARMVENYEKLYYKIIA